MYVIILGCGRVGSELAKLLSTEGHNVVVLDKSPSSFDRLGGTFNGLTIVGSGFDPDTLKAAGIEKADAFCAVTNGDNTNIMSAQVAKKIFNVPKVISRVYDPKRAQIYHSLGINTISGTVVVAALIRDKIIESRFSSYLIESAEVAVLEIAIDEELNGKKAMDLNITGEFLVTTVVRKGDTFIPAPEAVLKKGDIIMAVVKTANLAQIRKRFKL
jgi:trk system potassium uptake protein TrkA